MRTRDMGMACRHSSRTMSRNIIFYRYRERARRRHVIEAVLEESRIVALVW